MNSYLTHEEQEEMRKKEEEDQRRWRCSMEVNPRSLVRRILDDGVEIYWLHIIYSKTMILAYYHAWDPAHIVGPVIAMPHPSVKAPHTAENFNPGRLAYDFRKATGRRKFKNIEEMAIVFNLSCRPRSELENMGTIDIAATRQLIYDKAEEMGLQIYDYFE